MVQVFKHLLPAERRIWEAFLEGHGSYFESFEYDVHVGEGIPPDPSWDEVYKKQIAATSRYRIDVVGRRGREVWIIEVKPEAGASSVGQLLTYKKLYIQEFGIQDILYLAVVTDMLRHDMSGVFEEYGVKYFIVPVEW